MSRRRPNRKAKSDRTAGALLIALGATLLIGLGGGAWWLKRSHIQLDANNCPINGARAIDLIIIDRSDPVSPQQAQRIRQYIQQRKERAAFGTRFDVYVFEGDTKNELLPIFTVCAPGRPEDANELIENPDFIRRKYNDAFSGALDRAVNDLLVASTKPNSPIIESLRAAAISSFGEDEKRTRPLHAALISDMVQHTTASSHFRSSPDFSALSKSASWPSLRPDLRGVEVDILYILRPEAVRNGAPIQNRGHQSFWEQLIAASGGRLATFDPL